MILGWRHNTPNHNHSAACVTPVYLYHGSTSWLISQTWIKAMTVAPHLTQKSNGLLLIVCRTVKSSPTQDPFHSLFVFHFTINDNSCAICVWIWTYDVLWISTIVAYPLTFFCVHELAQGQGRIQFWILDITHTKRVKGDLGHLDLDRLEVSASTTRLRKLLLLNE